MSSQSYVAVENRLDTWQVTCGRGCHVAAMLAGVGVPHCRTLLLVRVVCPGSGVHDPVSSAPKSFHCSILRFWGLHHPNSLELVLKPHRPSRTELHFLSRKLQRSGCLPISVEGGMLLPLFHCNGCATYSFLPPVLSCPACYGNVCVKGDWLC